LNVLSGIDRAPNHNGEFPKGVMRIRVIRTPSIPSIDGVQLDRFKPGLLYELGNLLGSVFLAEGWAEPAASDEPAMLIPFSELGDDHSAPPNLTREFFPPYYDAPSALIEDRRRRPRSSLSGTGIKKIK
jgi:hypothetical protein